MTLCYTSQHYITLLYATQIVLNYTTVHYIMLQYMILNYNLHYFSTLKYTIFPPVDCTSHPDSTVLVFINIHATAVKRSALNPGTRFINSLLIIKTTKSNIRSKDAVPH